MPWSSALAERRGVDIARCALSPRSPAGLEHHRRQDPQLGALADNGGPTQTLLAGADAARSINAGIANGLSTDQRGLAADGR